MHLCAETRLYAFNRVFMLLSILAGSKRSNRIRNTFVWIRCLPSSIIWPSESRFVFGILSKYPTTETLVQMTETWPAVSVPRYDEINHSLSHIKMFQRNFHLLKIYPTPNLARTWCWLVPCDLTLNPRLGWRIWRRMDWFTQIWIAVYLERGVWQSSWKGARDWTNGCSATLSRARTILSFWRSSSVCSISRM